MCLCVKVSVCQSGRMSVCLGFCLAGCLSVGQGVCLSVRVSVCLFICLPTDSLVCLSVCLSVCLPVCLPLFVCVIYSPVGPGAAGLVSPRPHRSSSALSQPVTNGASERGWITASPGRQPPITGTSLLEHNQGHAPPFKNRPAAPSSRFH